MNNMTELDQWVLGLLAVVIWFGIAWLVTKPEGAREAREWSPAAIRERKLREQRLARCLDTRRSRNFWRGRHRDAYHAAVIARLTWGRQTAWAREHEELLGAAALGCDDDRGAGRGKRWQASCR